VRPESSESRSIAGSPIVLFESVPSPGSPSVHMYVRSAVWLAVAFVLVGITSSRSGAGNDQIVSGSNTPQELSCGVPAPSHGLNEVLKGNRLVSGGR